MSQDFNILSAFQFNSILFWYILEIKLKTKEEN